MKQDIRVLIVEDDPYARDLMTLLLARDWRTRVIADLPSEEDALKSVGSMLGHVDVIIFDTEIPGQSGWPERLFQWAQSQKRRPAFLCTGTKYDPEILKRICAVKAGGYVLKGEIHYTLGWAVAMADAGRWVTTPGIYTSAKQEGIRLPQGALLLNGTHLAANLTDREAEIARLAILFNMARRNLADELQISPDWAFEVVSVAYEKLGLADILSGTAEPESYFEDQPLLADYFRDILARVSTSPKKENRLDKDTLAFHLLTVPDVQEIRG
ncbi:MAG TPA: response regulator [Anaerolineaceae bacterium]|nr:response regulator [Anaerolineaceae bacterium]